MVLDEIQSKVNTITQNIENAYTSLSNKGATMPANKTSANLAQAIESVDTGNATASYTPSTRTLVITVS